MPVPIRPQSSEVVQRPVAAVQTATNLTESSIRAKRGSACGLFWGVSKAMRKPKAPAANRARILAAAIEEFAARGFRGASMDAIAARTHTTRALINYYFGGKEKVYLAVLEHVYGDVRQAEDRLDLDHLSPVAAIRRVVGETDLRLLPRTRGLRATGRGREPGGRAPSPGNPGRCARSTDRVHRHPPAGPRARPAGRSPSGGTSTRWRSTRPSPHSACST